MSIIDFGSTLRRFASRSESLSALDSPSTERFSLIARAAGSAGTFGFFLTKTPFSDFLMSFFAGTLLPLELSDEAIVGLEIDAPADNTGGGG